MSINFDQFWGALSDRQQEVIVNTVNAENSTYSSPEDVFNTFVKPRDTQAFRVFRRLIDSFNPTAVTGDQEAMLHTWKRAFANKGVALDNLLTDERMFDAADKQGMRQLLDRISNFAQLKNVRMSDSTSDDASSPAVPPSVAATLPTPVDYEKMAQAELIETCVRKGVDFTANGKIASVKDLRAALRQHDAGGPY